MAATRIICPECNATLRPAQPVAEGKRVKCPKCGAGFAAPGALPQQLFEPVDTEKDAPAPRPRSQPAARKADAGAARPATPAGARPGTAKPAAKPKDDDDVGTYAVKEEGGSDEEKPDISYVPDTAIKDLRGPAQAHLVQPSNVLIALSALGCLLCIATITLQAWPFLFQPYLLDHVDYFGAKYGKSKDDNERRRAKSLPAERSKLNEEELKDIEAAEGKEARGRILIMVLFLLATVYSGAIGAGAVKMQNMESRPWSLAAAIMTIIPLSGAGYLYMGYLVFGFLMDLMYDTPEMVTGGTFGLMALVQVGISGVGGWALRVLMLQEVIDGFNYVPE
jgi:hypothetical protein